MTSFEDSILRVLKGDSVVGAAFLVSDRLIATCAHVVEAADVKIGEKISLRLSNGEIIEAIVEPEFWRNPNAEDISILRLNEPLENLQPVILGSSSGTKGHDFSTFGFPEQGQELTGGGEIIGQATMDGIKLLQLRSLELTTGFSGAPVFDETTKRVVGMVTAITLPDKYLRLGATGFAISTDSMREVCSELKISYLPPQSSDLTPLHQLRPSPSDFVGRTTELNALLRSIQSGGVILGIKGMPGVGKTSLALKFAEKIVNIYPDAQLFLDLRGTHEEAPLKPRDIMIYLIKSFQPQIDCPENDDELEALYRSTLHGKKALLFLDNVYDTAQVIPLVPPKDCLLILTSRQHFDLPGLSLINLDVLNTLEARHMVQTQSISEMTDSEADTIADQCGYLPLAIRVSVNLLRVRSDWTPRDLIARLNKQKLQVLDPVQASLELSYKNLDKKLQKSFRQLYAASLIFSGEQHSRKTDSFLAFLNNSKELPQSFGLISLADVFRVWGWGDNIAKFHLFNIINTIDQTVLFAFYICLSLLLIPKGVFDKLLKEKRYLLLFIVGLPLLILWLLIGVICLPIAVVSLLTYMLTMRIQFKADDMISDNKELLSDLDTRLGNLLASGLVEYYGEYVGMYGRGLSGYVLIKLHDLVLLFAEKKIKENIFDIGLIKRAKITLINRLTSLGDIFDRSPSLHFPGFMKFNYLDLMVRDPSDALEYYYLLKQIR
jgi:hypothetical protein